MFPMADHEHHTLFHYSKYTYIYQCSDPELDTKFVMLTIIYSVVSHQFILTRFK